MEIDLSENCVGCSSQTLCEMWTTGMRSIEERAERVGALATEGRIICPGPRRFRRQPVQDSLEGLEADLLHSADEGGRICSVQRIMPHITDIELAEEAAYVWPGASQRHMRE